MPAAQVLVPTLALTLLLVACSSDGGGRPDGGGTSFDRQALLASLTNGVIVPTLAELEAETAALATAVEGMCGSVDAGPAQAAWRSAMTVWQRAAVMRTGPVNVNGLGDVIYSWPTVSACAVDQEVMARHQNPAGHDITTRFPNRRGLPALEYLLFNQSLASACASAPAGWTELSDADKRAARCAYAAAAAADLRTQAQTLHTAWTSGYAATLAAGAAPFRNPHEAVNAVSDALFVLDTEVKDRKLGQPAGITPGSCATLGAPCPQDVESPYAQHSKENVIANLRGFQALFTGGEGVGFDDFLEAAGAGALAATMTADLAAAIAAVEAIPGTLASAVVESNQSVRDAHVAVKRITDNLKSQFLTVLALDIPAGLGDDTD